MYQQRDSTEPFSDIHTPKTTRSDIDHPLIVDMLGMALTTMMLRCYTPSPQRNDHCTRASPAYPAPRPCAAKEQRTMGACVKQIFCIDKCVQQQYHYIYSYMYNIYTMVWHSGRTAHCPPTRTHIKRPLEDHLRYTG